MGCLSFCTSHPWAPLDQVVNSNLGVGAGGAAGEPAGRRGLLRAAAAVSRLHRFFMGIPKDSARFSAVRMAPVETLGTCYVMWCFGRDRPSPRRDSTARALDLRDASENAGSGVGPAHCSLS
jgi:hypothetical protein